MPYRTNSPPPKPWEGPRWLGRLLCWLNGCPEVLMSRFQRLGTIKHLATLSMRPQAIHTGRGQFVFTTSTEHGMAWFDVLERHCQRCGRVDRDLRPVDHDFQPETDS